MTGALVSATTVVLGAAQVLGCDDHAGCADDQYCSDHVLCVSCRGVCDPVSHNFDTLTCDTKCSKYLRSLYVQKEDLAEELNKVYNYVTVSVIFSAIALILILAAFFVVWVRYQKMKLGQKKNIKKLESIKVICTKDAVDGKKLKLEMPAVVTDAERNRDQSPPSALTAMTPLSTRHPSEDATLEYAYDNPTLDHSPVLRKNQPTPTPNTTPLTTRIETTF